MRFILISLAIIVFLSGCSDKTKNIKNVNQEQPRIEAKLYFRAFAKQQSLPGVSIVVIGVDGKVIDVLNTDEKGEAQKQVTISPDPKFSTLEKAKLEPRGSVTIIAYKSGYRDLVLLEVPASKNGLVQTFTMEKLVQNERNEPVVELGNNHRLEIITLVNEYRRLANTNARELNDEVKVNRGN
ncbi:MAG: hypothetical protein ACYC2T_08935 [Bacillota bacterium]